MSKYIKPRHIFKISLLLTCFFLTIATAFSSFLLSGSRLSGYSSLSFGSQSTMYAWYPLITNSKCISIHSIIYFSLRICSMHVYDQNVSSVFVKMKQLVDCQILSQISRHFLIIGQSPEVAWFDKMLF